jgi:hypothetical protein
MHCYHLQILVLEIGLSWLLSTHLASIKIGCQSKSEASISLLWRI